MNIFDRMMTLDRRWVFLFLAVVCVVTYALDIVVPVKPSDEVIRIYDRVNQLEEGDIIFMAVDYDPNALAELHPMTYAIAEHAFRRNVKIIFGTLANLGPGMVVQAMDDLEDSLKLEREYNGELFPGQDIIYGEDYVFLGYKPYPALVIQSMGLNYRVNFPTDHFGTPLDSLPMMQGVKNFDQVETVICMAAGNVAEMWITYGRGRYNVPLALGLTGVMGADFYPYYGSGQIYGLMAGMLGAAMYETLADNFGPARDAMKIQLFAHIVIVLFILMGNIGFLVSRRKGRR